MTQYECCQGSLDELTTKFNIIFTESIVRDILQDVVQALEFLHSYDIVHLDIKPGRPF